MGLFKKVVLGGALVTTGVTVAAGVRFALMKRQVENGTVDTWIKDVLGNTIPFEVKADIPVPAYITDEKSKIYFRFNEDDLVNLALNPASFKTAVQSLAAHELGHALDPELNNTQMEIHRAIRTGDMDAYKQKVLYREQRAWDIGMQYAPNTHYFNRLNKMNMEKYTTLLNEEIKTFRLSRSSK